MSAVFEDSLLQLARRADERRYGKFRGSVTDDDDPQKRARVRLRVPAVLGDAETDWALPCLPWGGVAGHGLYCVPGVGAQVWVEFEEGDIGRPLWTGSFWQDAADVPQGAAQSPPSTWLLQTPAGHRIELADKSGERVLRLQHAGGASLVIDDKGSIALTDAQGASLTLDADAGTLTVADANGNTLSLDSQGTRIEDSHGNRVDMAASGVTVKGQQVVIQGTQVMLGGAGGEPVIKGSSFLTLFATHMHPTAVGPSGPPIPQGEMSALSTKVMVA